MMNKVEYAKESQIRGIVVVYGSKAGTDAI